MVGGPWTVFGCMGGVGACWQAHDMLDCWMRNEIRGKVLVFDRQVLFKES